MFNRIVSQLAGIQQGLMHGDLGDLGSATISYKALMGMLDGLFTLLERGDGNNLDFSRPKLLELTARFLSCAQRMYLRNQEWNERGEAMSAVMKDIKNQSPLENYYGDKIVEAETAYRPCSVDSLANSPMVDRVLLRLKALSGKPLEPIEHGPSNRLAQSLNKFLGADDEEATQQSVDKKWLKIGVGILGACAEVFPLGACWTSKAQNSWIRIVEKSSGELLLSVTGGLSDLCTVIDIVCDLLETHGGVKASPPDQDCILASLTSLVYASKAAVTVLDDHDGVDSLVDAWRRVWSTVFSNDLTYRPATATRGTTGEAVLRLLVIMVQSGCVDAVSSCGGESKEQVSFLFKRQSDVWKLPVFERYESSSEISFELLRETVRACSLSDSEPDNIGSAVSYRNDWTTMAKECGPGQRGKLLCFCLFYLRESAMVWNNEKRLSVVSSCISALLGCQQQLPSSSIQSSFPLHVGENLQVLWNVSSLDTRFQRLWYPIPAELAASTPRNDGHDIVRRISMALHASHEAESRHSFESRPVLVPNITHAILLERLPTLKQWNELGRKSDGERRSAVVESLLTMKVVVTVFPLVESGSLPEHFAERFSGLLKFIPMNFEALAGDQVGLAVVLLHLIQILRAVSLQTIMNGSGWPKCFLEATNEMYDTAYDVLEDHLLDDHAPVETKDTFERSKKGTQLSFDDEDEDEDDVQNESQESSCSVGQKRRAGVEPTAKRARARVSKTSIAVNTVCARRLCYVMQLLKPSPRDMVFACEKLLGIDPGVCDSSAEVDSWTGVYLVKMICSEKLVELDKEPSRDSFGLRDRNSSGSRDGNRTSFAMILCSLVRAVRRSSSLHSPFHFFGYGSCAEVVRQRDGNPICNSLGPIESHQLVDLLLGSDSDSREERYSLEINPMHKTRQSVAAFKAFASADKHFHNEFVGRFAGQVAINIADPNGTVRAVARRAVRVAMARQTQDNVIDTIQSRTVPLVECPSKEMNKNYTAWYRRLNGQNGDTISDTEAAVWNDVFSCIQYDAVQDLVVIAECSTQLEVVKQLVFDLITLSTARPDLEFLCFQAVDMIAYSMGYSGAEDLLDANSRYLAHRWLDNCDSNSPFSFPLILSSPFLIRRLLWSGRSKLADAERHKRRKSLQNWNILTIRQTAAREFLSRGCHNFLPRIVSKSIATTFQPLITKEGRRALLSDPVLCNLCCILHGHHDDATARSAIEDNFYGIVAECAVLPFCVEADESIPERIFAQIKAILGDGVFRNKFVKDFGRAMIRLVQVLGEQQIETDERDSILSSTLLNLTAYCSGNKGSFNYRKHTNSSAMILVSHFWLEASPCVLALPQRYNAVSAVIDLFVAENERGRDSCSELKFCFDIILRVIVRKDLKPILPAALESAKKILQSLSLSNLDNFYSNRLFAITLDLYYDCKRARDSSYQDRYRMCNVLARKKAGFRILTADELTNTREDLLASLEINTQFETSNGENIREKSLELLEYLLHTGTSFGLRQSFVRSCCLLVDEKAAKEADRSVTPLGCLQSAIDNFLRTDADGRNLRVSEMLQMERNSIHSVVKAELREIETMLQVPSLPFTVDEISLLLEKCVPLCSEGNPGDVRIAVSRCLGELDANLPIRAPSASLSTFLGNGANKAEFFNGRLVDRLHASVVDYLVSSLPRMEPRLALVSLETLKGVLCVSRNSLELTSEKTRASVGPFLKLESLQKSLCLLGQSEIYLLRQRAGSVLDDADSEWCWGTDLWRPQGSFERWICNLVSALLVCYFKETSHRVSILSWCQKLAYLDPGFAQTIFPLLVLQLLQDEPWNPKSVTEDPVLAETWIAGPESATRASLSIGMRIILRSVSADKEERCDRRILDLALDVLEMLRQYTHNKFLQSSFGKRRKPSPKKGKRKYSSRLRLPYGSVLGVDGLLVVKACIKAQYFHLALLYAEIYREHRFGGNSVFSFKACRDRKGQTGDISGFGPSFEILDDIEEIGHTTEMDEETPDDDQETPEEDFLNKLRLCYNSLDNIDATQAVDCAKESFASMNDRKPSTSASSGHHGLDGLRFLDTDASIGKSRLPIIGCLESLQVRSTLQTYLAGLSPVDLNTYSDDDRSLLREKWFECRLYEMQWDDCFSDLPQVSRDEPRPSHRNTNIVRATNTQPGFFEWLVSSVESVRSNELSEFSSSVISARRELTRSWVTKGFAPLSQSGTGFINRFKVLNDLDQLANDPMKNWLSSTKRHRLLDPEAFNVFDPLSHNLGEVLLRSMPASPLMENAKRRALESHLRWQIERNFDNGQTVLLRGSLQRLQKLLFSGDTKRRQDLQGLRLCEAKLHERRGNVLESLRGARSVMDRYKSVDVSDMTDADFVIQAESMVLCSEWSSKYKTEPSSSILKNFAEAAVQKSAELYQRSRHSSTATDFFARALLCQGELLSSLFEGAVAKMKAPGWNDTMERAESLDAESNKLWSAFAATAKKYEERRKELVTRSKELKSKSIDIVNFHKAMPEYRKSAMMAIADALSTVGAEDSAKMAKHTYRFFSLWFSANECISEDADLWMAEVVESLPTFLFIPLLTQLLSRLGRCGSKEGVFSNPVQHLIYRMAKDHPYHCFIQLVCLSEWGQGEKSEASSEILELLKRESPEFMANLIENYRALSTAYASLAAIKVPPPSIEEPKSQSFSQFSNKSARLDSCFRTGARKPRYPPVSSVPRKYWRIILSHLTAILQQLLPFRIQCVFTRTPTLQPNRDYKGGLEDPIGSERVSSFNSTFEIAEGGASHPKIVICNGSTGGKFKQLVKGGDDARQDAVMEQVFGHVNEVMARQRRTRNEAKNNLRLLTYNIVPINSNTGVSTDTTRDTHLKSLFI